MKKRIKYMDMAKAIAFIFVVLGHTYYQKPGYIERLAFAFHMPLFFIVSGYFFNQKGITKSFLQKSAKGLLLPYVYTAIVIIIINLIIDAVNSVNVVPNIIRWISAMFYGSGSRTDWSYWPGTVYMMGATWFLLAMFWGRLILASVLKICDDNPVLRGGGVFVIPIAYVGWYMSNNGEWLPLSFYAGLTAVFFIWIGYLCRQYQVFEQPFPVIIWLVMLLVAIYTTMAVKPLYMVSNGYNSGLINVFSGIIISFIVIKACKYWEENIKVGVRGIAFMGKHTLLLIALHMFEGKFLPWNTTIPKFLSSHGLPANYYSICVLRLVLLMVTLICITLLKKLFFEAKKRVDE